MGKNLRGFAKRDFFAVLRSQETIGLLAFLVAMALTITAHAVVERQSPTVPGLAGQMVDSLADDPGGLLWKDSSDAIYGVLPRELKTSSESTSLELVGEFVFGPCYTVTTTGETAYFGDGVVMNIVDFSAPASPITLARLRLPGHEIHRICLSGNYAYVADDDAGLRVIDVSSPTTPVEVASFNTGDLAYGVAISGSVAYVADRLKGLRVIDVSDPENPSEIGFYDPEGAAYGVSLSGQFAYLANGSDGLRILDVTDPTNPVSVGLIHTSLAFNVTVRGNYAYLADNTAGFRVIDVSDPVHPVEVGHRGSDAYDVAVSGQYAYVAMGGTGIRIIDVSDPTQLTEVGFFDPANVVYGIAVSDTYVYVANYISGLYVLDASNLSQPQVIGSYDTGDLVYGVDALGSHVYLAERFHGLRVIDIAEPTRPHEIGFYDTSGESHSVAVVGNLAYVADGSKGLRIIDVSDPAHPTEVGFLDTGGGAYDVAVLNNLAYVADGVAGLRVIDVSESTAPAEVGFFKTDSYEASAASVAVAGNLAHVAYGYDGLWLVDVSNPANPIGLGHTGGTPGRVAIAGEYAYVVDVNKLLVFGVGSLSQVGSTTISNARAVAVREQYAYVAAYTHGLRVVDVGVPSKPVEVDFYQTSNWASDVDVIGNKVYVGGVGEGLYILRNAATVPVALKAIDASVAAVGIRVSWSVSEESYISEYVLRRSILPNESSTNVMLARIAASGLKEYEYTDKEVAAGRTYRYTLAAIDNDGSMRVLGSREVLYDRAMVIELRQNFPNPFNPETVIEIELSEKATIDLSVYDITGHFVTQLADGAQVAGSKQYQWNGRDSHGNPVASGLYFSRLRVGPKSIVRKMVLIR